MKEMPKISDVIIGQECICPDGLGRVAFVVPYVCDTMLAGSISVNTYIDNRGCTFASHNVELIDPRR